MIRSTFILLIVVATTIHSMPTDHTLEERPKLQFSSYDVAQFIEGLLVGVVEQEFSNLFGCINDSADIGTNLGDAVYDF